MLKNPHELQYIQSRAEMNYTVVDDYAGDMKDGLNFEAVKGIETPDGAIWIWDGAHRIEAAKKAGCFLDVELKPGSKADAEWAALSANTTHGLRRSPADIERVVTHALQHPQASRKADREIARHCGVSPTTVGKYRKEVSGTPSVHGGQIQRTVTRGGSTYQMTIPEKKPDDMKSDKEQDTPKESMWAAKCRDAVGKCFRTRSGTIVKIVSTNTLSSTMIGVSYTRDERREDIYTLAELSNELSEKNWLSYKRDYERTQEEQKERLKAAVHNEPDTETEEAPDESPTLEASPVECDFCEDTFEETEVYEVESNCSIICKNCAEYAYRQLSSFASLHTNEETMKFYTEDRVKIHQAGFQIYRPDWEKKRLNRHTDRGSWVKVEDFPTKKALKERIDLLEKDPKVVFDSH